ncbi:MAG: 6-phosphogluconolactonase [Cellulomonadaceae bacterium]|jgi:6-phosphogluconolactonase|nr:6-phosphogluconolactonase [Cellulomonadaceae bacterium]
MNPKPGTSLVVVHPDENVLAHAIAARWLTAILDLQSVQRPVHMGLTGGTLGITMLEAAAASPLLDAVDWTGVHLWWGDERFCPVGDADRNEVQAREALLDLLVESYGLPEANIHAVAGPDVVDSPEESAALWAKDLAGVVFDVLILGMGPDGHVASLFPGHPELTATGLTVGVHDSPKPPPLRVSLTFDAIRASREVWMIVSGAGKAEKAAAALASDDIAQTPAAGVWCQGRTLWLLDTAAADAP